MNSYFWFATAMLAGTIMGAGIFSLPFVVSSVGVSVGYFYLALFAGVYCALHLMYAHILSDEHGKHDLPHVVEEYLGPTAGRVASFTVLAELLFVLTAYLALSPSFFAIMLGASHPLAVLLFWAVSSAFIFVSLRTLGLADIVGVAILMCVVAMVYLFSIGHASLVESMRTVSWGVYLLPFGPLLFAMSGRPAIFKVVEEWRVSHAARKPFSLYTAVALGTLIPAAIYALFVFSVIALSGAPSSDALSGLVGVLPRVVFFALGLMGIVAIWKSYFMIGANIRDILQRDMSISAIESAVIVLVAPLLIYTLGAREFLPLIGFVGGVFLALEGIFIVAIWRKKYARHPLRRVSAVLFAVFALAILYELVHILS